MSYRDENNGKIFTIKGTLEEVVEVVKDYIKKKEVSYCQVTIINGKREVADIIKNNHQISIFID